MITLGGARRGDWSAFEEPIDKYLTSNGNQWFDVCENADSNLDIEVKYRHRTVSTQTYFGAGRWDDPPNKRYHINNQTDGAIQVWLHDWSTSKTLKRSIALNHYFTLFISPKNGKIDFEVDGEIFQNFIIPVVFDANLHMYFFARNTSSGVDGMYPGDLIYFKTFRDGVMTHCWIAKKDGSEWKPYDTVTKTFGSNLGTGTFSGGDLN